MAQSICSNTEELRGLNTELDSAQPAIGDAIEVDIVLAELESAEPAE